MLNIQFFIQIDKNGKKTKELENCGHCGVLVKALDSHRRSSGFDPRSVLTSCPSLPRCKGYLAMWLLWVNETQILLLFCIIQGKIARSENQIRKRRKHEFEIEIQQICKGLLRKGN